MPRLRHPAPPSSSEPDPSCSPCEDREVNEHVPVVVIGGGVMGLSTAWALTRRGEQPLVLERFARGHTNGASHGATRNFNNAYADEHYLDLLVRAREGRARDGRPPRRPLFSPCHYGAAR